jgi:choline kinase
MINGKTILEMMISHIQACGINEVVFVLGYLQEQIKDYVKTQFPDLATHYITNEKYKVTNTGYSLMLAKDLVQDSAFIKFDADVVFDITILKNLIDSEYDNCLCIDKNINLDAEEIKVIIRDENRVVKASKTVNPENAIGESIGIEKISSEAARVLFSELELMMKNAQHHQEYYEVAYERLIEKDVPFHALDISGLKWTEIDTKEDFLTAESLLINSVRKANE